MYSCRREAATRALMKDVMHSGICRMGCRRRLNSANAGKAIEAFSSYPWLRAYNNVA